MGLRFVHLLSFVLQSKAEISRRHVLGDAVVGGSHFVNRSSQRYFHNSCLYNVLHRTAAGTVTKQS